MINHAVTSPSWHKLISECIDLCVRNLITETMHEKLIRRVKFEVYNCSCVCVPNMNNQQSQLSS